MSSTTTIALSTLPPQRTSTNSGPTTPGSTASTASSGSQQTSAQAAGTPSPHAPAVAPYPPPSTQANAPSATGNTSTSTGIVSTQDSQPTWLRKARPALKVCESLTKFTVAVVGVSWAIYIGAAGLDLQRWSAKNDSLQSCLALESRSRYCNATIEAGVRPPPFWKRDAAIPGSTAPISFWYLAMSSSPATVAAFVVVTVAVMVVATVYFWPRMEPFHPVISSVRMVAIGVVRGITDTYRPRWTAGFKPEQHPRSSILENLDGIAVSSVKGVGPTSPTDTPLIFLVDEDDSVTAPTGCTIGVFYESDHESLVGDKGSDYDVESKSFTAAHGISNDDTEAGTTDVRSRDHENDLAITSLDLDYLDAELQIQHGDWSWAHAERLASSPKINKRKRLLLQCASSETLLAYLDCGLDLGLEDKHLWDIFYVRDFTRGQPNYDSLSEKFLDLPPRSRSSLLRDVLEELKARVSHETAMPSEANLSRDPVHSAMLQLCALYRLHPVSAAMPAVAVDGEVNVVGDLVKVRSVSIDCTKLLSRSQRADPPATSPRNVTSPSATNINVNTLLAERAPGELYQLHGLFTWESGHEGDRESSIDPTLSAPLFGETGLQ